MVRFLRNAVVAKVAGSDSSLLQISGDERQRVARIAELFSEEDLTRHLQIILRTHAELGYRQEQRFHLELGLLKMAHAQRLLPIEQLLSEVAGQSATRPRATGKTIGGRRSRESRAARRHALKLRFSFRGGFGPQRRAKPQLSAETVSSSPRLAQCRSHHVAQSSWEQPVAEDRREAIHEVFKSDKNRLA